MVRSRSSMFSSLFTLRSLLVFFTRPTTMVTHPVDLPYMSTLPRAATALAKMALLTQWTIASSKCVTSSFGLTVKADVNYEAALKTSTSITSWSSPAEWAAWDSNNSSPRKPSPIVLIKASAELQQKDLSKERTLLAVGTGSSLLAHNGASGVLYQDGDYLQRSCATRRLGANGHDGRESRRQ